jgi:KDO2-lipid IV(A) lauroyltransferase
MNLSKIIGDFLYLIPNRRKRDLFTNLNLVYPDMPQIEKVKLAKKVYENFVYNLFEFIKNRNITKEELAKKIELVDFDKVKNYLQKDKPVIFISAHYGNWEMLTLAVNGILGIPMSVVVRELDNKFLNNFFKKNRENFDIETFDKRGALKKMMKSLKEGRSVGILVDQNTAKEEGIDVEMFGLKALQTPVAAILSKKFNAPIIPGFLQRDGDKYKLIFKEPIIEKDIKKSVEKQNKVIEEMIKEKPEEWYWFHRRFKHYYEEKYK